MIIIRITRADLVLPRYLYHVIKNIKWEHIETDYGMTKMTYAGSIKMRREQGEKQMRLGDLCNVMEVDNYDQHSESPSGQQTSLMRGDITISEDNEVEIFE